MVDERSHFVQTLMGIIQGYSKGLWEISGAGAGSIMPAVGVDIWRQIVASGVDNSSIDAVFTSFKDYSISHSLIDDMDFNLLEGNDLEVIVKGCHLHNITDYLEENNVPRSIGCPLVGVATALMEDVTGDPYHVDSIESKDGNTNIIIKKI